MPLALLIAFCSAPAEAAGFRLLRIEAIAGTSDVEAGTGGAGISLFSDATHAWFTLGDRRGGGSPLREAWFETAWLGPVMGVVPPDFDDIVDSPPRRWLLSWPHARFGADASSRRLFTVEMAQHGVLNLPGFADHDPRKWLFGPTLGLGVEATWWRDWRDVEGATVATGKLRAEGGVVAGFTLRDTWYTQARATGRVDLFGQHAHSLRILAQTGVSFARVWAPLGVELRGELETGDDTASTSIETRWTALCALSWSLLPRFETRLEEEVEARRHERGTAE